MFLCKPAVLFILLFSSLYIRTILSSKPSQHCFNISTCQCAEKSSQHDETILPRVVDCPPWMFYNETSGACECSDIPYRAVLCDPTIPKTSILDCYCMTYNSEQNETELGRCLYGCGHKIDTVYYKLPQLREELNTHTCDRFGRTSSLCGKCKDDFFPLVYSYDMSCKNCTEIAYNWIKYIAVAYIPLTAFFYFVIIFRFSGTSPLIRSFISICQGMACPLATRLYITVASKRSYTKEAVKWLGSMYGIWNLDFFRTLIPHICLDITPLQALALDYAIALYPLLLVLQTYALIWLHSRDVRIVVCLWKPFHKVFHSIKQNWDMEGSVVTAFATFFLLSYLKIMNVTFDLLVFTDLYTLGPNEKAFSMRRALYYDPSVEYFGSDHLAYGIVAILVGTLMSVLPLVILVVYPMRWFQKCLNSLRIQRQTMNMFVNCYQGYYKDGTNGTKDFRSFSVTYFLVQLSMFAIFTMSRSIYCFPIGAIMVSFTLFITLSVQPYKEHFKAYNVTDGFLLFALASFFMLATASDEAGIKAVYFTNISFVLLAIAGAVPLLYIIVLTIWWLFVKKQLKRKLPCFRRQEAIELEESFDTCDIADRLEHPQDYPSQASPLLQSINKQGSPTRYGSGSVSGNDNKSKT